MNTRSTLPLVTLIVSIASAATAQNHGTWTNATTNSTWSNTANWSGGLVADGADGIADFSTLDLTANRTVNLGTHRTIGSLIFGDAPTASNTWTLANGTGGPWMLTLETSASTPVIQVTNQTATLSALLGGNQGFAKSGGGVLTLSNAGNSLSGGVTLHAGTLNFASGALGANAVTFAANATLGWTAGNTQDLSSQIKIEDGVTATVATGANNVTFASSLQTGAGGNSSVTKTGAGTLTFTAVNTYTGNTRVSAGRVVLAGGDDRLANTSALILGQGAASGILQLGDLNASSGQTFDSIATAGSGSANAIIGGHSSVSQLTIANPASVTYAGLLGGAGSHENNLALAKSGAGILTLTNSGNSFTGNVNVQGGTLAVTHSTALGAGPKIVTISGTAHAPTLRLDGSGGDISLSPDLSLVTSNDNTNSPAILNLAGTNTVAGSLSLTSGGFGTGNTRIKVTGGTLTLTGDVLPEASVSAPITVIFDSAVGTSGEASGALRDSGAAALSLTKASAGAWTLSGASTYTGTTTVNAGTLRVADITSNGTAQPLGTASSAILLGSAGSTGTLEYFGSTAATLGRGITVNGTAGAVIVNSGGATLTLGATQARGGRPLTYAGGDFVISGRITGTATVAPLTIDAATVRLTHNNNTYVSPTSVQNNGTLIVANTLATSSATGTGTVTIAAGSTLTGTGYVRAGSDNSILIQGSLLVGDPALSAAADLDLFTSGSGSTVLASGSALTLDLWSGPGLGDQSSNTTAADVLRLGGALELQSGATLKLGNPNNLTAWNDGDVFRLFDWSGLATLTGTFVIDAADLGLPGSLSIDTTHLYTLGTIAIIAPEPSRALLLALAGLSIVFRRRRSAGFSKGLISQKMNSYLINGD